jgi:CMP-N-acetylneuraminic acid synthetase
MYKGKSFLAIIPARGGSKRLPGKNIKKIAGKPLIAWTIDAALKSKYIDKVIVSTDDESIKKIAREAGAEVPFDRPAEISSDTATSVDVILHALENVERDFDFIVLLQPTSPLRNSGHIDEAIEFLIQKNANAVISVGRIDHSLKWVNTLPESLAMDNFLTGDLAFQRSQGHDDYYILNGAVYICSTRKLKEEKSLFLKSNIYAFVMGKQSSVDIDNEDDFDYARYLLEKLND